MGVDQFGDCFLNAFMINKFKEKILITGGAGFVGTALIKKLLRKYKDIEIVSIDNYSSGKKSNHSKSKRVTYLTKDTIDLVARDLSLQNTKMDIADAFDEKPAEGERDIGVFLYKTKLILSLLRKKRQDRRSESGFLNLVRILSKNGSNVNGYKIATKREALSFNSRDDLLNF